MVEGSGFAERLKTLRRIADLTQIGLAKRSGVSVSAVRQFEQQRREPNFDSLLRLARGLGVSLGDFDPVTEPDAARPSGTRVQRGRQKPKK